jgi:large subunit ribosomal protein L23
MIQKSPYQILIRPMMTEKTQRLTEADEAQFTFEVANDANKREIKWAVETAYGVKVQSVNTVLVKGKTRYSRMRGSVGKRPDRKKAVVKLAEGQKIELL